MKNILVATVLSLSMATNVCAQVQPAIPSDARIEKKVESLLKKMTLEEKVGQMCEITIDVITDFSSPNDFKLSEALLDTVIGKYKIGSILNVPLSVAQTKEKWAETIRQIQEKSLQEIGIPCIYGVDQIHGTTYTLDGTLFPQGINMAATFNRDWYAVRAKYLPTRQKPVVSLGHMLLLWTWDAIRAGRVCGKAMVRTVTSMPKWPSKQ